MWQKYSRSFLHVDVLFQNPWKQDNIENEASLIIPVPEPICGAVIIGQESILYHNGSNYVAVAPPVIKVWCYVFISLEFLISFSTIVQLFLQESIVTCYARIDAKGTSYLLGNMAGQLLMLLLMTEESSDGTIIVKKPKVEVLGMRYSFALLRFLQIVVLTIFFPHFQAKLIFPSRLPI